jgi:hypothetical protein
VRTRTALLTAAVVVGAGLVVWRLPVTRRFVGTVREASAQREAELREAVEVAVRTDATSRAPRHGEGATVPHLDVEAGWDPDRRDNAATPLGADDPGRSFSPEEARALLLDPTGPGPGAAPDGPAAAEPADGRAPEGR